MNQLIYRFICISLCALVAVTAHAQTSMNVKNIRLHGNMTMGDTDLSFTLITKGQNQLRATIQDHDHQSRIHITYNQEQLQTKRSINGTESVHVLKGTKGAENLLDLLALNPEFHFNEANGFNLDSPIFDGYMVEYIQSEKPFKDTDKHIPKHLNLFEVINGEPQLIHSIKYVSFQGNTSTFIQPKELILTDETTGKSGKIFIHKVDYNSPLPSFLFKLPKVD